MELNDVTLREADQMPGRSYTAEQKVAAGTALDRLGVAFVQPGFPVTGEVDRTAVSELADAVDAEVVGLARSVPGDVDAALDANADVVDVFAPGSDLHLEYMVGKSRAETMDLLADAIDRARDGGAAVHVSLTDAFRTDVEHLVAVFERFPQVEYVNLADTVGARTPATVAPFLERLGEQVDLSRAGVHFHDDLGVGTANVLAAKAVGVGKADVAVASLGERAGNSSLEEVVAASAVDGGDALGVNEAELVPVCREVLAALDEPLDRRKAVLGAEVSEHESGLHTAAMLDDPTVFEPYDPARFGGERRLVFGVGTGRGGARKLLERVGVEPTEETVATFLAALAEHGPLEMAEALELAEREFGD